MAQKYDLTDIGNALSRVMDNPMTKIIRSGSIGVLGVVNPVAGIVGGIGNDLLSEYNTFKLGHLLNGLASGFNLERRLNELYNYVNSSPEKAIIVANLFKQTVNAECPKVCVIYGLILANHLETLTEFTHECNLVRRTEKGRLRRRGWGLRWEKAQKGGKGTNLRGFFED